MKKSDIARLRLRNQGLSELRSTDATDVVAELGAVQAQDYAGAKWALGQRLLNATDAAIEDIFNEGRILRTHILRPTWHFVAPADIHWMLKLSAPRVHAANAFMYRKLELDTAIIQKSYVVLEKALQGKQYLTRSELGFIFDRAGIAADGLRLGYFLMSAELDGIVCSGPRKGKQFTYALLEERAPNARTLNDDEALAELTGRYFRSRGPATLQDFAWWSGLRTADAKKGMDMVRSGFVNEAWEGRTYWFSESELPAKETPPAAYLLPNYDEYFIGFRDRSAIGEVARRAGIEANHPALIAHIIILDGQVVGGWKRALKRKVVALELHPLTQLTRTEMRSIANAADQYGRFLGRPLELVEHES